MKHELLQEFTFYDYSEIQISFVIKTKLLDLDTLISFLNFIPTRGWTKGEKYSSKYFNTETKEINIIERERGWTMFVYETNKIVNSNRFREHADYLLEKLDSIRDNLKNIVSQPEKFEILIYIYLSFDTTKDYFGFSSPSITLRRLTEYCHQIEWRNK